MMLERFFHRAHIHRRCHYSCCSHCSWIAESILCITLSILHSPYYTLRITIFVIDTTTCCLALAALACSCHHCPCAPLCALAALALATLDALALAPLPPLPAIATTVDVVAPLLRLYEIKT